MPKLTALFVLIFVTFSIHADAREPKPMVGQKGVYSVKDFGTKGDGKTDDTAAFQKALDKAGKTGGIVFVPAGAYMIKDRLNVPSRVTLEGVFQAPPALSGIFKEAGVVDKQVNPDDYRGTLLLTTVDRGTEKGKPFIFLNQDSVVKGLAVYYPEQDRKNPVPYPWCIGGSGDNCSIIDVLLVNPWQAVDFGSYPCGRHYIKGLYAQPIKTGIYVDVCLDVGRIQDVHFWPFWDVPLARAFTEKNGTAFVFGRTDWEYVDSCFCIFFNVGFKFIDSKAGPANVVISNSGSDTGPIAVLVEKVQPHAGIAFTNCQFMAGIDIRETNNGPVKFTNCGFWGLPSATANHAKVLGGGHVTFNTCHFTTWDKDKTGVPCIYSDGLALTVSSCDFMDSGKNQIVLGENQQNAIVMGNLLRGGIKVENKSKGKVEMGLNVGD